MGLQINKKSYFVILWMIMMPIVWAAAEVEVPQQVQEWQQAATEFLNSGNLEGTQTQYDRIIQTYPGTVYAMDAQVAMVLMSIRSGNTKQANTSMESLYAYKEQDGFVQYAKQVQDAYWWAKMFQESNNLCQWLLAEFPSHPMAVSFQKDLVNAYINLGDKVRAQQQLEVFWSKYKKNEQFVAYAKQLQDAFWMAGNYQESNMLCQRLLKEFSSHPMALSLQKDLVNAYINLGDMAQARQQLEIFWSKYKDKAEFVEYAKKLQDAYWLAGNYLESNVLCQRLLKEFPSHSMAVILRHDLVIAYLKTGNTIDAESAMGELLASYSGDAKDVSAVVDACWFYRQQGDCGKALEIYQKLLQDHPESERVLDIEEGLVAVYLQMGAKQMADTQVAHILEIYSKQPTLPLALNKLGNDYHIYNYYKEAIHLHEAALALNPNEPEKLCAHSGLARAYARLENDIKVQEELELILSQFGQQEKIYYSTFVIGEEYYYMAQDAAKVGDPNQVSKGLYAKALAVWQDFENAMPDHNSPQYPYFSGLICQKLGDYEQAMTYYQRVIKKWPGYEKAWHAQFMMTQCMDQLGYSGKIDSNEVGLAKESLYKDILRKDPNTPVGGYIRNQMNPSAL